MADVLYIISASMCMQFVVLYLIKTEFRNRITYLF